MQDARKFALEEAARLTANTAHPDGVDPQAAREATVKTAEAFLAFLEGGD